MAHIDSGSAGVTAPADHEPASRGRWWTLAVVCIGPMMAFVNVSSTLGGLATIQADLHPSSSMAVWIASAYSLVVASLVLGSGTIGDLIGRRLIFATGAAVFAVGSAVACAAHDTAVLIAGQVVMGIGGAMILPTSLAIISHTFTDTRERTEAVSMWAGSSGLGLAIGPLGAGLLVGAFSWHSIYLINVVLGGLALLGACTVIEESRIRTRTLDLGGITLGTVAIAALTFAVIEGGSLGYTEGRILWAYAVLAVSLVAFIGYEARHSDPMLDVTLFRSGAFSAVMGTAAITLLAFTGTALVTVLYFQHVQEISVLAAAARLMVMFGPFILISAVAARIVHRIGFKTMLTLGLIVMAAGIFALLASPAGTGFARIWPGLLLAGIGSGMLIAPTTAAAVNSVAPDRAGMASAAVNMFRQVGNVLGASVLGTILTTRFAGNLGDELAAADLPRPVVVGVVSSAAQGEHPAALPPALAGPVGNAVRHAFTDAAHLALSVAAIALLITTIPVAIFVRQDPAAAAKQSRDDAGHRSSPER
ncbi:MFS transporter [Nocardia sp. NPDC052254]|uniref:MFS transporter n=1 Tax=Nocardia sp. NPDC052254 TaxID=3155681 RepID=UPI0034263418